VTTAGLLINAFCMHLNEGVVRLFRGRPLNFLGDVINNAGYYESLTGSRYECMLIVVRCACTLAGRASCWHAGVLAAPTVHAEVFHLAGVYDIFKI
jgi:hypothetical protein